MTARERARLSGLARNPAATEQILVRLARDAVVARELASRRRPLPDAVAETILAHRDPGSALFLHGDRVSPAIRARIAADPDPAIRYAHRDFVRSMVEREVFLPVEELAEAYARSPDELARDPDPRIRAAVADAWWTAPAPVRAALLTDPDPTVRTAASRRAQPPVPVELHPTCLADPATRAHVAGYAELTDALAFSLATDPDHETRQAVARNPRLSAEVVAVLVADPHPLVRAAMMQHPGVDERTRDRLHAELAAEKAAGSLDARVALDWSLAEPIWLRELPLPARLSYLDSRHVAFRRALAGSRDLPPEAWRRLDADPDWRVRRYAATRPDTPPEVLERLVREHGDGGPIRPRLVEHPNFPATAFARFAEHPEPRVRCLALAGPDLAPEVLNRLTADPEPSVRRAAAGHRGLHPARVAELLADEDDEVVRAAAAHPALPAARAHRILDEAGL
ncbi:hypothetical protein [Plantactinospora sonchi]|uniref:LRV domain-containing protein n=1 Tax=Plantactinospora sonchi TaxID=1544735 RepID=A0ABU7S457_9ACTN